MEQGTAEPISHEIARQVLGLPMQRNDAEAETVRDYLVALLDRVWDEGEGFSGKRPFGNSSWEWDVLDPLGRAGLITVTFDDEGFVDDIPWESKAFGRRLIAAAIRELGEPS